MLHNTSIHMCVNESWINNVMISGYDVLLMLHILDTLLMLHILVYIYVCTLWNKHAYV